MDGGQEIARDVIIAIIASFTTKITDYRSGFSSVIFNLYSIFRIFVSYFYDNIYDRRKRSFKDSQMFFPIPRKEIPLIRIFFLYVNVITSTVHLRLHHLPIVKFYTII